MKKVSDKKLLKATEKLLKTYDSDVGKLYKTIKKALKVLKRPLNKDFASCFTVVELHCKIKETANILEKGLNK
jgi:hypothetical protein